MPLKLKPATRILQFKYLIFLAFLLSCPNLSSQRHMIYNNQLDSFHPVHTPAGTIKSLQENITYKRLDSVINKRAIGGEYLNHSKELYFFDSMGVFDSLEYQMWDNENQKWEESYKQTFIYNDDGLYSGDIDWYWNNISKTYILEKKSQLILDEAGRKIIQYSYSYDINIEDWVNHTRTEYTYENEGKQEISILAYWDTEHEIWNDRSKRSLSKNDQGQWLYLARFEWSNITESWKEESRWEQEFDSNNRLTEGKYYTFWPQMDSVKYLNLERWSYDSLPELQSKILLSWNFEISDWTNISKTKEYLNQDDQLHEIVKYNWNNTNLVWDLSQKDVTEYDDEKRMVSATRYKTNTKDKVWKKNQLYEYSYEFSNEQYPMLVPGYYIYPRHYNMVKYDWDIDLNEWIYFQQREMYFSDFTLDIVSQENEIHSLAYSVYPNPTTNHIYISTNRDSFHKSQILLFDMNGKLVFQSGSIKQIGMNGFNDGAYFLLIMEEKRVVYQDIIIKK